MTHDKVMAQGDDLAPPRATPEPMRIESMNHGLRSNDSEFTPWAEPDGSSCSRVIEEELPFTVSTVQTEAQLAAVQALRSIAYEHHLPGLGASFGDDDAIDRAVDCTIFFAKDKATGAVVGSARIQTNQHVPMQIEHSTELPFERQGQLLAEITRLVVRPGYVGPVRMALVKAIHLYCLAAQIRGLLAGSRSTLLRSYRQLGFTPLFNDGRMVALQHAGGLPHHVLIRDTMVSNSDGRDHGREAYEFIVRRFHPDIEVFPHGALYGTGPTLPARYASAA